MADVFNGNLERGCIIGTHGLRRCRAINVAERTVRAGNRGDAPVGNRDAAPMGNRDAALRREHDARQQTLPNEQGSSL